jgi:iron complex outermembrane receptor protein
VEADLTANPIDGLDVQLSAAYLDTEYDKFTTGFTEFFRIGNPPTRVSREVTLDYTGNQLVGAPRWSAVGSIQYTLPLPGLGSELVPRFSFTYKDRVFFDPNAGKGTVGDLPENTLSQDAYWLLNASLTWRVLSSAAGTVEVTGWGRNLTDEEYRFQSFDATDATLGFVLDAYGAPRTYGITVRAAF